MIKVICIFGISGVEKSTMIKKLDLKNSNLNHVQASKLISIANDDKQQDTLRLNPSDIILQNQEKMLSEYKKIYDNDDKDILFDGHSIIDNGTEIIQISISIIRNLFATHMIFLKDKPENIYEHKNKDNGRRRSEISIEQINYQQKLALQACENFSSVLNIPLEIIRSDEHHTFTNTIKGFLI